MLPINALAKKIGKRCRKHMAVWSALGVLIAGSLVPIEAGAVHGRADKLNDAGRAATARVISGRLPNPIKSGALLARILPDEVSATPVVQVTLPALPCPAGASTSGKSKSNDGQNC